MKELTFFPDKRDLTVKLNLQKGVMVAAYSIELFEPDGITPALDPPVMGHNVDEIDDFLPLPTPIVKNDQRFLLIEFRFEGLDPNFPNYSIEVDILQEEVLIDRETRTGLLTGEKQGETIMMQFLSQPPVVS